MAPWRGGAEKHQRWRKRNSCASAENSGVAWHQLRLALALMA